MEHSTSNWEDPRGKEVYGISDVRFAFAPVASVGESVHSKETEVMLNLLNVVQCGRW